MSNKQKTAYCGSRIDPVPIPEFSNLAECVLSQFKKHGYRTAFTDWQTGQQHSFAEVYDRIAFAGSGLRREGFEPGDVLSIVTPNTTDFSVPFLAAISLGGAVSGINPSFTSQEISHLLNVNGAKYVLVHPSCGEAVLKAVKGCNRHMKLYSFGGEIHQLKPFEKLYEERGDLFDVVPVDVKNTVAILPFSSGTTGFPKAVMLTHHNFLHDYLQFTNYEQAYIDSTYRRLSLMPNYHIYGICVDVSVPMSGSHIIIQKSFDPKEYLEAIQTQRINYLYTVPPIINFLLKHPLVDQYDLSSVENILCAAAALGPDTSEQLMDKFPSINVLQQGWGMTELSPVATMTTRFDYQLGSSGKLIPTAEAKFTEIDSGQVLGQNETGEIWIRGPIVMKGYLNNEKATNETIVDGWLRTGDVGYYNDNEEFFITDRVKELIKYKGLQVAPAELEELISMHPGVADVGVVGIADERAGELPKAFVVKKSAELTQNDVIKHVEANAASHKWLRGGVEFLETLPRNPTGKILRRKLRES